MADRFRVALIEDVDALRDVVQVMLESTGRFEIVGGGATGADGLAAVRETRPDLALIDLHLPDTTGWDLVPMLKDAVPSMRIVVLSGSATRSDAPPSVAPHVDAMLEKGAGSQELASQLLAVLEGEAPGISARAAAAAAGSAAEAEAAKAAMDELERFVRVASHDLAQPLQIAFGYLELLKTQYGDSLDPQARQWLDSAATSLDRMRLMVRSIVRYARFRDSVERTKLDTAKLVAERWAAIPESVRGNAELTINASEEVFADAEHLATIIESLLENAVVHAGEGVEAHVQVDVEARREGWVISVSDNGPGIDKERHEKVFEPFERSVRGRPGLGLSIAMRAVTAHDGRIWVEDTETGQGAKFSVFLPRAAGASTDNVGR